MDNEIVHIINEAFSLQTTEDDSLQLLSSKINELIIRDFNKLVQILYRADISEKKLKTVLEENKNADAGNLIAILFIERQAEKIRSRREHRRETNDIPDEERW